MMWFLKGCKQFLILLLCSVEKEILKPQLVSTRLLFIPVTVPSFWCCRLVEETVKAKAEVYLHQVHTDHNAMHHHASENWEEKLTKSASWN